MCIQENVLIVLAALVACQIGCDVPATSGRSGAGAASSEAEGESVQLPPEIMAEIERLAQRQAGALKGAEFTVHRVFELKDDVQLPQGSKQVAVDVELAGDYADLDLDDVEIVDAKSDTNLTYCGDIRPLKEDGSFQQNRAAWETQDRFRVLLVFLVPETLETIELDYWEQRLTEKPLAVGKGELKYDEGNIIAGLEFWKWPASYHTHGEWQHGQWLIAGLSDDAAVVDLAAWPPETHLWKCDVLADVRPAPSGGWMVLSRTGSTRDDIEFNLWHHPADQPGQSPLAKPVVSPGDHLEGIVVLGEDVYAFEKKQLYQYVPADGESGPSLAPVDSVPAAVGHKNILDSDEYAHAQLTLGSGQQVLLWDGDGYELVDGRLQKTLPLDVRDSYFEFVTIPADGEACYYLENSRLCEARRGEKPQQVMKAFDNIMSVQTGPDGTVLFSLGQNDAGYIGGIWFPKDDSYIPILPAEIDPKIEPHYLDTLHWSAETEHFYLLSWSGVYTFPGDGLLSRERVKLPDAPPSDEAEVE